MAVTLSYNAALDPQFLDQLFSNDGVITTSDTVVSGGGAFPMLKRSLANGTGANNANKRYRNLGKVLAAAGNDDYVLNGGTIKDTFGNTINFTKIKWVILRIVNAATGLRLLVGHAAANVWPGWWSATTATDEVRVLLIQVNDIDGWAVSANDTLRINNPSGSSVTYDLIIIGEG